MIDLRLLRENPDVVREAQRARRRDPSTVDAVLEADSRWRETTAAFESARAVQKAMDKAGITASELDLVEINEAFGAVVAHSARELGVSEDIVNIHGGGIAIGHPIGASGARLVVHAAHELARRGSGTAVVSLCGGGGQGEALILTR